MNIYDDKPKENKPQKLIVGNLYAWKTTPTSIYICVQRVNDSAKCMVRLSTGSLFKHNPESSFSLTNYIDVTDQYCLKKINTDEHTVDNIGKWKP